MLLQNRARLEEAKQVGLECEDMARDIKFNLQKQSDKLENSTLRNLFGIQRDMVSSNRLIKMIQSARLHNRLVLYGIAALLALSICFILYISLVGVK